MASIAFSPDYREAERGPVERPTRADCLVCSGDGVVFNRYGEQVFCRCRYTDWFTPERYNPDDFARYYLEEHFDKIARENHGSKEPWEE